MTAAQSLFGITGLTIGGVGVWALVALAVLGIVRYWVIGMPDRKRADNEGEVAHDKLAEETRTTLFSQMLKRMADMEAHIQRLEKRVEELESERRAHLTELIELRGAKQVEGRVRQRTQEIVSADRVNGANS